MRFTVHLTTETDDGTDGIPGTGHTLTTIERPDDDLSIDDLGLCIEESKTLLAALQIAIVEEQALAWCRRERACPCCGEPRRLKDRRSIRVRTPFGKITVPSPRYRRCECEPASGIASPIVAALPERVTPDLLELEAKWTSFASYGITADRIADVLPVGDAINAATIRNDAMRVAERPEAELGPEQKSGFILGCPAEWDELPPPGPPATIGIDGSYVRSWGNWPSNFEVIVGKSVIEPEEDGSPDRRRTTSGLEARRGRSFHNASPRAADRPRPGPSRRALEARASRSRPVPRSRAKRRWRS